MQKNHSIQNVESRKLIEGQLLAALEKGLPPTIKLTAYNYSRAGTSLYALLHRKRQTGAGDWLTLRLTDHPLWLKEAQQLSVDFGNPLDLNHLPKKIERLFKNPQTENYFYEISPLETAVLQFLDECQKSGLIWAVRLPEEIFAARKQVPLDLKTDFMKAGLFLGNRNNLNTLLLPVESKKFQAELAVLYGRNLLFSQFARGRLLRLLPTNQWIQPLIEKEKGHNLQWREKIAEEYGQHLIDVYKEGYLH